ncbi:MAG: hypothetical protein WA970_13490 [Gammaproteobacteria bacterium]
MKRTLILGLFLVVGARGFAQEASSPSSRETPPAAGAATEPGAKTDGAPEAVPPLPTERLPAGSPVSFPIDI